MQLGNAENLSTDPGVYLQRQPFCSKFLASCIPLQQLPTFFASNVLQV